MPIRALALVAIVIAGLGIRVTYAFTSGHATSLLTVEGNVAHNIDANGRWFVRNVRAEDYLGPLSQRRGRIPDPASVDLTRLDRNGAWYPAISHPIGTSVAIAGIWTITGSERYIQPELLQCLMDALAALLVYWICMQFFSRARAALLAAGMYALYPPIAWYAINPYDDIWAVDFTIAIVALYLVIMKSQHRWRWLLLCGVVAGIGAYFRPQVLLIVPLLALATVRRVGWRETLRRALTPTLVAGLLLVPWTVRNYERFHVFIPTRSGLWETMVGGLNELPTHIVNEAEERILRAHPGVVPESLAWESYLKPYFIRAVEQHPLFYLEVLVHRLALSTVLVNDTLWMHRGAGGVLSGKGGVLDSAIHRPLVLLEYALPPAVFVLAMIGLAASWRRWRPENWILVALVLSVILPYLPMHVEERYLLPAFLAYFIWIGLGVDLALERLAHRAHDRRLPRRAVLARGASG